MHAKVYLFVPESLGMPADVAMDWIWVGETVGQMVSVLDPMWAGGLASRSVDASGMARAFPTVGSRV